MPNDFKDMLRTNIVRQKDGRADGRTEGRMDKAATIRPPPPSGSIKKSLLFIK